MHFLASTIILFATGIVPGVARADENLLQNPAFDQGKHAPAAWVFNSRKTESLIAWDKERGIRDNASLRITNGDKTQSGNVVQSIPLDPPLPPGSRIEFSAMAACRELSGTGPRIVVYLQDASGDRETATAAGVGGTHDFVEIKGTAAAGRTVVRLVIYLCNYGTGTVWWDDARVTVARAAEKPVVPRPKSTRDMSPVTTDDGLGIVIDDTGGIRSLTLDGRPMAMTDCNSGLWLQPFDGAIEHVSGTLRGRGDSIEQSFHSDELGVRVAATFRSGGEFVECSGTIEDLTGNDRGMDVIFGLPVGEKGWRWGKNIRDEIPLAGRTEVLDETTFSAISNPATGTGLALAIPPDSPCDFQFGHLPRFGYQVRFRFGLSHAAEGDLKGRAPFRFVVYRIDGRWGLRDAARRYYRFWPKAFAKRVKREGLWMFGSPRFPIPDPDNYAFHEAGPAGWEFDDAHRIHTCPYIIPGQREIKRLANLPQSKPEALEIFNHWKPGSGDSHQTKAIIENCMLHAADGLPQIRIRDTAWGGNSITFPLNANPRLFADSDKPTVAKTLLAQTAAMHDETPNLDGIYVDSLGAWGDYANHRREHFAFARVPLGYDPNNGRPVIHNRFSLLEFIWSLRDQMHGRGKLLFANGLHHNRRFHYFALDVMGVEGHGRLEHKRVMAYQKPFLLLIYNVHGDPQEMEYYYHLCTFYGIYPSFANMRVYETPEIYAPVAVLNDRFVPVLRQITSAGWQPITHARSLDANVWLERWGPNDEGTVYLTLYNPSDTEARPTLKIETNELCLSGAWLTATDILSSGTWRGQIEKGHATLALPVPARQVRVLRLESD